ncbi:uncharacterized protein LOC134780653 [Penaeus indicus]|uniref:uncharacterized protein LOC134780653 n=1 Tax=Penaeus indicus TaxID=29960 RepID=UPI00300D608E
MTERFRKEPVAIMGDIECVEVPEKHKDFLRFCWWPKGDSNIEPKVFRMTVHWFGAISSPACANMALRQVVIDSQGLCDDEVMKCISEYFYVDDCLKSVPTSKGAIDMIMDLKDLCKRGKFNLRDCISNSKDVLESIPVEDRIHQMDTLGLDIQTGFHVMEFGGASD